MADLPDPNQIKWITTDVAPTVNVPATAGAPDPSQIKWITSEPAAAPAQPQQRTDDLTRNIGPLGLPYGQQPSRAEYERGMSRANRIFLESIGGLPQAIGETIARGANVLQKQQITPPSEGHQTHLQRAGYPQDQGALEKASSVVGAIGVGAAADPLSRAVQAAAQRAPAAFQPAKQTAKNATTKELLDAKIPLPPSIVENSKAGRAVEALGGDLSVAAQKHAQPRLQQLAAKEVGLDPTRITDDALEAAAKVHIKQGYEPIKKLGTLSFGKQAGQPTSHWDVSNIHPVLLARAQKQAKELGQSFDPSKVPGAKLVTSTPRNTHPYQIALDEVLNKYKNIDQSSLLAARVSKMRPATQRAEEVLEQVAQIRSDASGAFRRGDYNYGKALRELGKALEDQIERNLVSRKGASLIGQYRHARTELAKNYAVKDMLVDPDTGIIDTTKAFHIREVSPLTGGLETIAKAGSPVYREATKPPVQGEKSIAHWVDRAVSPFGVISGLAGAPFTGGATLPLILTPLARMMARQTAMSPAMQAHMARGLMAPQPSALTPAMQRGMVAAPFPLFSQGEQ